MFWQIDNKINQRCCHFRFNSNIIKNKTFNSINFIFSRKTNVNKDNGWRNVPVAVMWVVQKHWRVKIQLQRTFSSYLIKVLFNVWFFFGLYSDPRQYELFGYKYFTSSINSQLAFGLARVVNVNLKKKTKKKFLKFQTYFNQ